MCLLRHRTDCHIPSFTVSQNTVKKSKNKEYLRADTILSV